VTGALGVTVSAGIESGSHVLSVQPPKVVASGTSGPIGEPSVLLSPQPSVGHSTPSMVGMLVGTAGSSGSTVPPSGGHSSGSTTGQSSTQSSLSSSSGVGVPAGLEPSSLQSPHSGSSQHSSLPTVMLSVGSVGSTTQSSSSHIATVAAGVESSPSPDPQLLSSQSSLFGEQESSVQSVAGGGQVESSLQSDVGLQSSPSQSEPADVAGTSVGASVGHAGAVHG